MASDGPDHEDRGSVTAEFALALPAVVLMLLLVVSLSMQGAARVAVEDAARTAAREVARGEHADVVKQVARESAGNDVSVDIEREGEYAVVTVKRPVQVFGLIELRSEHRSQAHVRVEHLPGSVSARW